MSICLYSDSIFLQCLQDWPTTVISIKMSGGSVQAQDTVKKEEEKAQEDSEEDEIDAGNVSYQVLNTFKSDLALLLETSCVPLATKLSGKGFIDDNLRSKIVLRNISPSSSERMQVLLMFIYDKMKQSPNPEKMMGRFKKLLDDKVYSGLVEKLGKL